MDDNEYIFDTDFGRIAVTAATVEEADEQLRYVLLEMAAAKDAINVALHDNRARVCLESFH